MNRQSATQMITQNTPSRDGKTFTTVYKKMKHYYGAYQTGGFHYSVPEDAVKKAFDDYPEVTTVIMSALDAHGDGPNERIIRNR